MNRLQIADAEKDRLIGEARAALTGPFRHGYETMLAAWTAIEPRAHGNQWRLEPAATARLITTRSCASATTTNLTAAADPPDRPRPARPHPSARCRRIMTQVGFHGTLQDFFHHITTDPEFRYPDTEAGRQPISPTRGAAIARGDGGGAALVPPAAARAAGGPRGRGVPHRRRRAVAFYNRPSPDGSRPGIIYVNIANMATC